MKQKEQDLDELAQVMEPLPQVLYNVAVKEKKPVSDFPEISKTIKEIEKSWVIPEGSSSVTPEQNLF
jgi:phosphoglucosamine mutase